MIIDKYMAVDVMKYNLIMKNVIGYVFEVTVCWIFEEKSMINYTITALPRSGLKNYREVKQPWSKTTLKTLVRTNIWQIEV